MARLTNIWRDDLSRQDFDMYPIWTWDDANEGHHPTDELVAHPEEHGVLFIKCKFRSPDGTEFLGYLIGCSSFYAFGFFVCNEEFGFNLNLPDFADQSVEEIRKRIGKPEFQLFPLAYESEIKDSNGQSIKGILERSKFRAIRNSDPSKRS